MAKVKLMVLYPQPTDEFQFEEDYLAHLALLHVKLGIPADERPYSVTQMLTTTSTTAPFYKLFSMPFDSAEALQHVMASPQMREIAIDAARISSGGAPVVLVGSEIDIV